MDFSQFIKQNDPKNMVISLYNQPSSIPHLHDPFLRRYHITKITTNAAIIALTAWTIRLLTENM